MPLSPQLLIRLQNQHLALTEIAAQLSADKLNMHPEPGKWSIYDNIAHLTSYQDVFIGRIKLLITASNLQFNAYRADDDPAFIACQQTSLPQLFEKLNADRQQIYQLLITIPDENLSHTALHPKYGTLDIPQWTEFFLLHEAHHLFTIFKLAHS